MDKKFFFKVRVLTLFLQLLPFQIVAGSDNTKGTMKISVLFCVVLLLLTSCSGSDSVVSMQHPIVMLIFGVIMLAFWWWVFVNGLVLALSLISKVFSFILKFFLPYNDWED